MRHTGDRWSLPRVFRWIAAVFLATAIAVSASSRVLGAPGDNQPSDEPWQPPQCPQVGFDNDNDSLTNCVETWYTLTDPDNPDTDDDNITDWYEVNIGTDPNVPDVDTDGDGWPDALELHYNEMMLHYHPDGSCYADPNDADTDDDGILDTADVVDGVKGNCNWNDSDNDRVHNPDEAEHGTDPWDPDTDGDGFSDFEEITWGANPIIPRGDDLDQDGLLDLAEIGGFGTDPNDPDTDDDGFEDGEEVEAESDPLSPRSVP